MFEKEMNPIQKARVVSFATFILLLSLTILYSPVNYFLLFILLLDSLSLIALLLSVTLKRGSASSAAWFLLGVATVASVASSTFAARVIPAFAWVSAFVASADFAQFLHEIVGEGGSYNMTTKEQMTEFSRLLSLKGKRTILTASTAFLFSAVLYDFVPVLILPNPTAGTAIFAGAVIIMIVIFSHDWLSARGFSARNNEAAS
ncbi:MAG: hypothetical protein JRN68_00785 [Nitrososphaerota archaeon]|nr:hypothetical protein [Nitrososphaerota archaeon]